MTDAGTRRRLPSPGAELARLGEAYFTAQHSYDPYNATLLGDARHSPLPTPHRRRTVRLQRGLGPVRRASGRRDRAVQQPGRQARDAITATTHENVRSEVDRYIAWPGQALAYVTGKREIMRLRERAQRSLGSRFELRRFHHAVLRNGAIPLSLLDGEIERWTATEA